MLSLVQVIPSVHRGTGNGIAISVNRVMGILSAIVATEADVSYHRFFSDHDLIYAKITFW